MIIESGDTENLVAENIDENFLLHYEKVKMLGEGAFGEVFHCIDTDTGKEFAVKTGRHKTPKKERRAFQNEIKILKVLDHPNIVRYYGSSIEGGHSNIFMELVTGRSVRKLIEDIGPLNNRLSTTFLKQILTGLY